MTMENGTRRKERWRHRTDTNDKKMLKEEEEIESNRASRRNIKKNGI